MNWNNVTRFNFTYALPGGAWLEDGSSNRQWFPFSIIETKLGQLWIDRLLRKQGWNTGSWVDVADETRRAA